jgi:hypothetical protein
MVVSVDEWNGGSQQKSQQSDFGAALTYLAK